MVDSTRDTPFPDYAVKTRTSPDGWIWEIYRDGKRIDHALAGYSTQGEALAAGRRVEMRMFVDPHDNDDPLE